MMPYSVRLSTVNRVMLVEDLHRAPVPPAVPPDYVAMAEAPCKGEGAASIAFDSSTAH